MKAALATWEPAPGWLGRNCAVATSSPSCTTIHTRAVDVERTPGLDESVPIGALAGIVVLDVTDGLIETIEILFRPDLRALVRELLPS